MFWLSVAILVSGQALWLQGPAVQTGYVLPVAAPPAQPHAQQPSPALRQ